MAPLELLVPTEQVGVLGRAHGADVRDEPVAGPAVPVDHRVGDDDVQATYRAVPIGA